MTAPDDGARVARVARRPARTRRPLFVWGAGAAGRAAIADLRRHAMVVAGVIDRNPALSGSSLEGVPVLAPAHLQTIAPRPRVLIASMYWREIGDRLREMGFRAGRDFEAFPDEAGALAPSASTTRQYAEWHRRWRVREGLARTTSAGPGVRVVRVRGASRRDALVGALGRLDGQQWVLLVDASVVNPRWQWRRGTIPAADAVWAAAIYDYAPASASRAAPFLLRALAGCARLEGPVLCRAAALRRSIVASRAARVTIGHIDAALRRRHPPSGTSPAGACSIGGITPSRVRRLVRSRVTAPALVQFAAALAEARAPVFSSAEIVSFLPAWSAASVEATSGLEYLHDPRPGSSARLPLSVRCHSSGNSFFTEIRDILAATWRRAGALVHVGDQLDAPSAHPTRNIVVAPHEFFVLGGHHPAWDTARHLVLVNTEQPQTRWFSACLAPLLASAAALDLNWQTALLLRTLGVNAHFLPLGWDAHASLGTPRATLPATGAFRGMNPRERRLPAAKAWDERPIDILFVGTLSARRAGAFAGLAPTLARHRCFLHLPPSDRPLVAGAPDSLDARDVADLCRRSKVVLNVHRDHLPYCEWHRVMFQAMRHGALVVTEPMMLVPGFRAGRDFLTADLERMPALLERLLGTAAGRARAQTVASTGAAVLRRHFDAARIARRTLRLL